MTSIASDAFPYFCRSEFTAIFSTSFCILHRRWYDFICAFRAQYLPRTLLRAIFFVPPLAFGTISRQSFSCSILPSMYVSIFTRSSKLKCAFLLLFLFSCLHASKVGTFETELTIRPTSLLRRSFEGHCLQYTKTTRESGLCQCCALRSST